MHPTNALRPPTSARRDARMRLAALALAMTLVLALAGRASAQVPPPADVQIVAGEAFMTNGYTEVGTRANGSFGSDGDAPAGYHPRTNNPETLGFRVDRDRDGWGVGVDDGDFFTPGGPFEGFFFQVGNEGATRSNDDGNTDLPGANADPVITGASVGVTWESTAPVDGLSVRQVSSVQADALALDVDITLTNDSGATMTDVYYARGVDPDNCVTVPEVACDSDGDGVADASGVDDDIYDTLNRIVMQEREGDPMSVVSATQTDGSYIDLRTSASGSVVVAGGNGSCDPYEQYDNFFADPNTCTELARGTERFNDDNMFLIVRTPELAPGASRTFRFSYFLSAAAAAEPVPETPGQPTAVAGDGSATITVVPPATGPEPTSYTVSASEGGGTCTVTAPDTACTITGLTNGTAYTFTAVAVIGSNTSPLSPPSEPVTPAAPQPEPEPTAQTITFSEPDDVAADAGTVTLEASASSGLPVAYTSLTPAVCTVAGDTVTLVAAGTCRIEASQDGDDTYAPAPRVTVTFTVEPAADGTPPPQVERLDGLDRIGTAVAISGELFPNDGQTDAVVVATADTYADALAGARLASAEGGPLLLTGGAALDAATADEISRLLAADGTIYVLGGERALSAPVADALDDLVPGATVTRLWGADRYATALAIAEALDDDGPIYLASGTNFPDGLAVAALAAHTGGVVVLSEGAALPAVTAAYLRREDPNGTRTVPVGGPAATAHPAQDAIVGADRYETARLVAERFTEGGEPVTTIGLATGDNWPDSLTGAAAMGFLGGPLLLTPGEALAPATRSSITTLVDEGTVTRGLVFGGTAAVSAETAAEFSALVGTE